MSTHKKRWSASEKLEILNYYKKAGATKASREFGVSSASIYKWKEAYEKDGEAGLSSKRSNSNEDMELIRLRRENDQLKALVAEKELALRIQAEMLKKSR